MFYRLLLAGISFLSFSAVTKVASLTIVANATIYTVNPDNSWAEAIAIDDNGIILAVGNTEDIFQKYKESSPTIISMNQRLVLPGFICKPIGYIRQWCFFDVADFSIDPSFHCMQVCILKSR